MSGWDRSDRVAAEHTEAAPLTASALVRGEAVPGGLSEGNLVAETPFSGVNATSGTEAAAERKPRCVNLPSVYIVTPSQCRVLGVLRKCAVSLENKLCKSKITF